MWYETPWFRKFEVADRFLHQETAQLTIFGERLLATQSDTQWRQSANELVLYNVHGHMANRLWQRGTLSYAISIG